MIDGNITNKGRQTTRAVIVSDVLFSPFSRLPTLALLYFCVPLKKERLIAGYLIILQSSFSRDVMSAILVYLNKEKSAMLVYYISPVGVGHWSRE